VKLLLAAAAALLLTGPALAQAPPSGYDTMANAPNAGDFVKRADTGLTLLGNPLRLAGMNIPWLALRSDTGHAADSRYPTAFEITDVLSTVQAMGGSVIRIVSAGASAGCTLCIAPAPGLMNEEALKQVDLILQQARDMGLKVIIPLAGSGASCGGAETDPVASSPCVFAAWRGKTPAEFFTDPIVKADFDRYLAAILQRVNSITGIAYRDDPTILAWENCDACGAGVPAPVVAAWTEEIGEAIKALDRHHLYENGAFAGRLAPASPGAVPAASLALPSVDVIGDQIIPAAPGPATAPGDMADAADAAAKSGRAYVIDAFGWTPKDWKTPEDFEAFLNRVVKKRIIAGALVTNLQGHADQGGFLPVPPNAGPESALYFPGTQTDAADLDAMQARARVVRRFAYRMAELPIPAFLTVNPPKILHVDHGRIVWQGAAGATDYTVERSQDPHVNGSWKTLCTHCTSDATAPWQDPDVPKEAPWYRLTPYNANAHAGLPSDPVQSK
jgi:mannan endo-1,4-beta-mannosidase